MRRKFRDDTLRRVCFVTGTRAEYGLMRSTLSSIAAHPALSLQIIATGSHLDSSRGSSVQSIRQDGYSIAARIPWSVGDGSQSATAIATGKAISSLAARLATLQSDIVLVVGDRVEAFAAASAAHLSGKLVAHVHGGDRALGLVDDSLRHSITKLAHVHFPATQCSAARILAMGEDKWRIFRVGSPGLDDVRSAALALSELGTNFSCLRKRSYALLLYHPQSADPGAEGGVARALLNSLIATTLSHIVVVYPNNDPGSSGIADAWDELPPVPRLIICRDLPRPQFLGLMRESAILVGNSSSGIIEAASFGMPVLDVGVRQTGRERGENVIHVGLDESKIRRALRKIWNAGNPIRFTARNIYGTGGAGFRIAETLSRVDLERFGRKLIAF
jgi:GDP/UDP-N,N'-diacetylbacillosamine 2-epimerase (hydrolysing)